MCQYFWDMTLAFSVSRAFWTGSVADDSISHYDPDSVHITAENANIGVDSQGNLYAIWSQARYTTDRGLQLSKSTDGGITWSARTFGDQLIASADGDIVPVTGSTPIDIAFDSYDNIYVVWAEDLTTTMEIMLIKSTDGGATWIHSDADWPISYDGSPYNDAKKPAIAIDGNDHIHVVWYEQNSWEIFYSRSEDYGDSWTGQSVNRTISYHDADRAWFPDIAIASDNNIYVIWIEGSTTPSEAQYLHYGKSTDGGQTFNSETADYPITGSFTWIIHNPSIAIGPSDNIHVVCQGKGPGDAYTCVYYTRSTDGSGTWSGLSGYQYVDRGPAFGYDIYMSPSIATTSTGALCVVWSQKGHHVSPNIQQIWASYSTDAGSTWTGNVSADTVSFNEGTNYAKSPVIINAPGDTLHVVWEESITNGNEVHYSRSDTLAGGEPIPTLSEWGMIILALLLLAAGTFAVIRRHRASLPLAQR